MLAANDASRGLKQTLCVHAAMMARGEKAERSEATAPTASLWGIDLQVEKRAYKRVKRTGQCLHKYSSMELAVN